MPLYRLAKEYSQPPHLVAQWPAKTFDEAWDIYLAENVEKWPVDPDNSFSEHPRPNATTILDHEQAFWMKFAANGRLDPARLEAAGYSETQIPWLESEMKKLGWL